jgi:hypothetical protein
MDSFGRKTGLWMWQVANGKDNDQNMVGQRFSSTNTTEKSEVVWKDSLDGSRVLDESTGEIKKTSENHLLLEQGRVHKHRFWIPKFVADAFDGKVLRLMLSEEKVRGRYHYGIEPPTQESYASRCTKGYQLQGFKAHWS